jgi:hypothetical protein
MMVHVFILETVSIIIILLNLFFMVTAAMTEKNRRRNMDAELKKAYDSGLEVGERKAQEMYEDGWNDGFGAKH